MKNANLIPVLILLLAVTACSSSPTSPPPVPQGDAQQSILFSQSMETSGRHIIGMWELVFDFDNVTATAIPARFPSNHFNVRKFLEQGPCFNCLTLMNFSPQPDNTFFVDVQLIHPFPGLDNLTGFDVRGTAIFNGSYEFPASGLTYSDRNLGDLELLNTDGLTTLFNPIDFPEGSGPPLLTYSKGKFATPLSKPATLNGYRSFFTDPMRRAFEPGQAAMRTYEIAKPSGTLIRVGYVVDASWAPGLPPEANCYEAYRISAVVGEGLMPGCSFAPYEVDVWDWQGNSTIESLTIESPDLLSGILVNTTPVDMGDFVRFSGNIPNELEVGEGSYRVLLGVNDAVPDPLLGDVTAYKIVYAQVTPGELDYDSGWRKDNKTLDNSNYNPWETSIGTNLAEVWNHQFASGVGAVFNSTPTLGQFGVYYVANIPYAQEIWALDLNDGTPIWDSFIKLQPDTAIYGSVPLVGNCEVYVGGSSVFSFDAEDGDQLWGFEAGDTQYVRGGPIISDGVLLIWGFNNTLYAFNPVDGDFKWSYTLEEFPGNPDTPAVQNGIVYGGDVRGNAFALNITNGSEIWQVSFPGGGPVSLNDIRTAPVIAGGLVWIGSYNCNLYGLNLDTGITEATVPLNDRVPGASPAFDGAYLYQPVTYHPIYWQQFTGPFGVLAVDTSGSVAWEFNPVEDTEGFNSSPVVANGTVYVASDLGTIYMLDPSDGATPIGTYTLDSGVTGGMSILDGRLYVCDSGGKLYCLENN